MTKQQIIELYQNADRATRMAISHRARLHLAENQVHVSRQALHLWRVRPEKSRSKIDHLYHQAYQTAINEYHASASLRSN